MDAPLIRKNFSQRPALADALAEAVAIQLQAAIDTRGAASLAVSGGSTPDLFFAALSIRPLAWEKVTITPVDERWVAHTSKRSNARLIRNTLLQNHAARATFVPLYTGAPSPEAGLAEAAARLERIPAPFGAVVLGMGEDGHTASFFPQGDNLTQALDLQNPAPLVAMRARGAGEPRLTLTLSRLLHCRYLALHIEGKTKSNVLARAQRQGEAMAHPVCGVLCQTRVPVHVFWCA